MNNSTTITSSIGFFDLLTIVFIVLKLTNVINWSWWWVLSPIWIPLSLVIVVCLIILFVVYFIER
jgi:hypothetical protein